MFVLARGKVSALKAALWESSVAVAHESTITCCASSLASKSCETEVFVCFIISLYEASEPNLPLVITIKFFAKGGGDLMGFFLPERKA